MRGGEVRGEVCYISATSMDSVECIVVQAASAEYEVWCGSGALRHAGELVSRLGDGRSVFFLSSPRVWKLWGAALVKGFPGAAKRNPILFNDSERAKRLATIEQICRALARAGADRRAVLAALGGGVVGDMAGFAAATYLRGVALVHVPTTLVAQADSAIGGKTGVNLPEGKNLVGAFYQPSLVIADTDTLRTLPAREYRSGLYEVVKYGVTGDAELFDYLEECLEAVLGRGKEELGWVVPRCIRAKAWVVGRDERESGLREMLNFGHTVGHGLEAATGYRRFLHGEGVGWGMIAATEMAREMKLLEEPEAARIVKLIARIGPLPAVQGIAPGKVMAAMRADKKARGGKLRWVLPRKIGEVKLGVEAPDGLARNAIARLTKIFERAQAGA